MKITKQYKHYHSDGTLWAKGTLHGKTMDGYWEWFRKDGSKMRSGTFNKGKQVGEWITYDSKGKIVKKTYFKNKAVDAYIKRFPAPYKKALADLRNAIIEACPNSEEIISYGMPAYRYHGMLVYFSGFKNHIGLYALSSKVLKKFKRELAPYGTEGTKVTIRFTPDKPMPKSLITKIVKEKMKINLKEKKNN